MALQQLENACADIQQVLVVRSVKRVLCTLQNSAKKVAETMGSNLALLWPKLFISAASSVWVMKQVCKRKLYIDNPVKEVC